MIKKYRVVLESWLDISDYGKSHTHFRRQQPLCRPLGRFRQLCAFGGTVEFVC